jgi:uncharacterized membrane protein
MKSKLLPGPNWLYIPIAFTMLMLIARMISTNSLNYIFLAWNLFLAWMPFWLSTELIRPNNSKWNNWLLFGCWLLFLPNAPYIITDFLHLKQRWGVPVWYDTLLVFSASLNGLMLAFLSIRNVDRFLTNRFGARKTLIIITSIFFLCAFGIYVGRFLRYNSWDIVMNTSQVLSDVWDRFINPFEHTKTWGVTILFGLFLSISYFSLKNMVTENKNIKN